MILLLATQDLQRKLAASRRQVDEVTGEANKLRQELSQKALEAEERLQEAERRVSRAYLCVGCSS